MAYKVGIMGIDLPNEAEYFSFIISNVGEWATAKNYAVNDVAYNTQGTYLCTAAHLSESANEPGVGASWEGCWQLIIAGSKINCPPMTQKLWHYGRYMGFCIGNVGDISDLQIQGNDVWVLIGGV
jgi:hypothetical protein